MNNAADKQSLNLDSSTYQKMTSKPAPQTPTAPTPDNHSSYDRSTSPAQSLYSTIRTPLERQEGVRSMTSFEVIVPMTKRHYEIDHSRNSNMAAKVDPPTAPLDMANLSLDNQCFSTDPGCELGRYFRIDNVTDVAWRQYQRILFHSHPKAPTLHAFHLTHAAQQSYTTAWLCFNDLRKSSSCCAMLQELQLPCSVHQISQEEFAKVVPASSLYDGQVFILATWSGGRPREYNHDAVEQMVREVINAYGSVRLFRRTLDPTSSHLEWRVEFDQISSAKQILEGMNPVCPDRVRNWTLVAQEIPTASKNHPENADPFGVLSPSDDRPQCYYEPGMPQTSPTGRSSWHYDSKGQQIIDKPVRTLPPVAQIENHFGANIDGPRAAHFYNAPFHHLHGNSYFGTNQPHDQSPTAQVNHDLTDPDSPQYVDVERIEKGQDVRTTLMLRSVPNRFNCWQLKSAIDASSYGRYDFLYLRMDFARGTNVGYAFINFVDARDVVNFVRNHLGNRWIHNNHRTVEVSYATIQGLDCLIEKFRNSVVMDEAPDYRPKMFYTDEDAPSRDLIGTVRAFPGYNNASKKQRSQDNAGHLGLFSPQANHHTRNHGRRSQFDRGTPAQLHEERMASARESVNGFQQYRHGQQNQYQIPRGYAVSPLLMRSGLPAFMDPWSVNGFVQPDFLGASNVGNYNFGSNSSIKTVSTSSPYSGEYANLTPNTSPFPTHDGLHSGLQANYRGTIRPNPYLMSPTPNVTMTRDLPPGSPGRRASIGGVPIPSSPLSLRAHQGLSRMTVRGLPRSRQDSANDLKPSEGCTASPVSPGHTREADGCTEVDATLW